LFTFQVEDDGGTANGGIDLDLSPNTFTFSVSSVSDSPFGGDNTVYDLEDTDYVFKTSDFLFSDPKDSPPDAFAAVLINTLPDPITGVLMLNGNPVPAGQLITVSSINAGQLVFRPAPNGNGTAFSAFKFQVKDSGVTASGGMNLEPDFYAHTITINVTPVNDAPVGTTNTIQMTENQPYAFQASDFGFSDPNDLPQPNNLMAIKITTLPQHGMLLLNGVVVST
jgi:hypothetical protein